jgi:hypothetical protein
MTNKHLPPDNLLTADGIEEIFCLAETDAISTEEAVLRMQLHLESINSLIGKAEDRFSSSKIGKGSLFNYTRLKPTELKKLLDTDSKLGLDTKTIRKKPRL